MGLNDGFCVPVQDKGLGEFFLNITRKASIGHKRKNLEKHLINQRFEVENRSEAQ